MNEENQVYFIDSDKLPPAAAGEKAQTGAGSVLPHKSYGIYGGNAGYSIGYQRESTSGNGYI